MTSPLSALTATWNNGATVFTALKMNVTDTASDSTSKLMDLQVGGASKFNVDKTGLAAAAGGISAAGTISTNTNLWLTGASVPIIFGSGLDGWLVRTGAAALAFGSTNGGVNGSLALGRIRLTALPTSASGLSTGDLWNNLGIVNVAS